MNAADERMIGLIFFVYPLLIAVISMCAYDLIRRTVRVCWKNRKEWLA